jgi:hypothetical protein
MAIIQTDILGQKIHTFIQENDITMLKKIPPKPFKNEHNRPSKPVTC